MIDILLPVYRPSHDFKKTIESVLNQSYENFQLIIINDSNSSIDDIVTEFNDKRIMILNLGDNYGISHALWCGCISSKSRYISRIDDGDFWHSSKLSKQVEFLENNSEYILCATQADLISNTLIETTNFPTDNLSIKYKIEHARSCIIHTSIIFRNIGVYYKPNLFGSEDMYLYKKLINKGKFIILGESLVKVLISNKGLTGKNWHSIMLSHIYLQCGKIPLKSKYSAVLIKIFEWLHFPLYKLNLINLNIPLKKIILPFFSFPYFLWQFSKLFKGRDLSD